MSAAREGRVSERHNKAECWCGIDHRRAGVLAEAAHGYDVWRIVLEVTREPYESEPAAWPWQQMADSNYPVRVVSAGRLRAGTTEEE